MRDLDEEIACMIRALDKKKRSVKEIGVPAFFVGGVQLKRSRSQQKHKEVPYMLTEEVERDFIREERKQK